MRSLQDCADICTLTAKYLARHSSFSKSIATLCAQICEVCGHHCLHHPDDRIPYFFDLLAKKIADVEINQCPNQTGTIRK